MSERSMHSLRLGQSWGTLTVICLCLAGVSACTPSDQPPPTTEAAATAPADNMRGVIERLGTTTNPRELIIRHEPTKDMDSMAMPFVVDSGISIAGLAVGDKVAFRLETDPKSDADRVVRIDKLPADVGLNIPSATVPGTNAMKGMPGM
jgi:Cu/Ag efflux protein CusF